MIHTTMLSLPLWCHEVSLSEKIISDEDKMRFVIELSHRNVKEKTGGPFAAAVFTENHDLISIGVNAVVNLSCSVAHAEVLALMNAQRHYQCFDLGSLSLPKHTLVTSAQMCVMCFGATLWSGVHKVIFGANAKDVEDMTGFDEGPLISNWIEEYQKRNISVVSEMLRDEACVVLKNYAQNDGIIYNGKST